MNKTLVEVHFFKASGKWYLTENVSIPDLTGKIWPQVFEGAVEAHLDGRLRGMTAVTIQGPFPVMFRLPP